MCFEASEIYSKLAEKAEKTLTKRCSKLQVAYNSAEKGNGVSDVEVANDEVTNYIDLKRIEETVDVPEFTNNWWCCGGCFEGISPETCGLIAPYAKT